LRKEKEGLPNIRSRELGSGIRRAMQEAGLGVRELARRLGWSHPYISHLLSGSRKYTELDLLSVLLVCNVGLDERRRLLELSRELGIRGWLQQYDSGVPEQPRTLIDHERKATDIVEVQLVSMPKLLQTEGYARASIGSDESRVRDRLARQVVFTRSPPPRTVFYLHESLLHKEVGDMSEQLHHLLRISVRPSVELRVVPGEAGISTESFTLVESGEFDPVVYLEGEVSAVFLEKAHQIAAYRRVLAALESIALDRAKSRDHVAALAAGQ
jgi:transcriptional regulator with XRE-family HTH domain